MLPKIVILGGSSPFTAALIDAFADPQQRVPAAHLMLQGRTISALQLLANYARHQLDGHGWRVDYAVDLDAALQDSQIIVHQIRYGGLAGRAADERLAVECEVAADETLGPSGFQAALRCAADLQMLGDRVARIAPSAWLLNLTNPLSLATAVLAERIGPRCVGLCELPWNTVREACELVDASPDDVNWCYAGLNHRGFVYRLSAGNDDLLARLGGLDAGQTIGGIGPEVIRGLGALPLKYFRLLLGGSVIRVGRAAQLRALREQILSELAADPQASPPSLAQRATPWYRFSVAPVIATILSGDGRRHVLNVADGPLVRELPVEVHSESWGRVDQPPPPAAVADWLRRFEEHERAALAAVRHPCGARIAEAVGLDPLTPPGKATMIARRLTENWVRSESAV